MKKQEIIIPFNYQQKNRNLHATHYQAQKDNFSTDIVILCHGFTGDQTEWGRFIKTAEVLITDGFDILTFDFPGSGKNDREPIFLSKQVASLETVYRWVQDQGYSKISVVGLSFGGLTTLYADLPEVISTIFWAPGFFLKQSISWVQRGLMKIAAWLHLTPITRPSSGDNSPILIDQRFMNEILQSETELPEKLSHHKTPSLILHGTTDHTVDPALSYKAYRFMPQDEHHKRETIEGADHDFHGDHLSQFIDKTLDWLHSYH